MGPKSAYTAKLSPFPHPHRDVPRLHRASTPDIERCLDQDEPVVLPDELAKTPFSDKLEMVHRRSRGAVLPSQTLGKREVTAASVPVDGRLPGGEKKFQTMTFAEFARALEGQLDRASSERLYMQNQSVGRFPEIEWKPPALTHPDWEHAYTGLWIGPGGQIVNFHYDNSYNFMCMIRGRKRVALLPFNVLPDVYPLFDPPTNVTWSSVRLLDPNFDRFPNFRRALEKLRVVTLEPGDLLFIPPHWWHHVESFGLNVMISNRGCPFPLTVWRALGRVRVDAFILFSELSSEWRNKYAMLWDQKVFRNSVPHIERVDGDLEAGPARERAERNLAEAAALFERVPEIWRRHGQLAFHYFVFHKYGYPMNHHPGAYEDLIWQLKTKLQRGEVLSPFG